MPGYLLDLNVLMALAWRSHSQHQEARAWFHGRRQGPWFTCALTQTGFLRLACNPAVVQSVASREFAARILRALTAHREHRYLEAMPDPLLPAFDDIWNHVQGYRQISDGYLLCAARHHGVKLATFDKKLNAVPLWASIAESL